MITAWLQSCDFSSKEYGEISVNKAIEIYKEYDWAEEFSNSKKMDDKDEENCPPGLGLVHSHGHIMHICPEEDGTNMVHYHLKYKTKIFGFIPIVKDNNQSIANLKNEDVIDSIKNFFNNPELSLMN